MENAFLNCPHCGSEREIVIHSDDIPDELLETCPDETDFFLFCPSCELYTAAGYGGSASNSIEKPKLKFVSKPPLNGPCPCGSGKKYKRCCVVK